MSGGVCLSPGYTHFVMPMNEWFAGYRSVLVHELTHVLLQRLPVPPWLNEALAMRMEEVVCGETIFRMDEELYERHAAMWDAETIQLFWSGEA